MLDGASPGRHRDRPPTPDAADWNADVVERGRCGHVDSREGEKALRFHWEFGGGDVIAIVSGPFPDDRDALHPRAKGRAREIMRRIAEEVQRRRAPGCSFELDKVRSTLFIVAR
jgi:hypothetical protein